MLSPRAGRGNRHHADKQNRSRGAHASELCHNHNAISKKTRLPARKQGAERRKAHANHRRLRTRAHFASLVRVRAAARSFGARSPSGALLRHSPGRTHPPLAQLQFPRFLRPDLAGVTRFALSRVYRAPRRPVVLPVERWPRAARERMANPPAGTALTPLFRLAFRKGALHERGGWVCNWNGDECQGALSQY
jgi:hypothetical protein